MKTNKKLHLSVFFCLVMALTFLFMPLTSQEVFASDAVYINWSSEGFSKEFKNVEIEQGAKFYIGDYAIITDQNTLENGVATSFSKAKYSSSNKSVITVNSKGLLTAKKTGTSTIKIKYKGKTLSKKFKVVKKGSFEETEGVKAYREAAGKLKSVVPKKITKANALKCTKAVNSFVSFFVNSDYDDIYSDGFLTKKTYKGGYVSTGISNQLAVPDVGRYIYLNDQLWKYGTKYSPTSINGKGMKISSMSANKKQITVKLKKAITTDHILAANIKYTSANPKPNKTSAVIEIDIYDKTASEMLIGYATISKGSKTVKIDTIKYTDCTVFPPVRKTRKLKKGHTYVIGTKYDTWGEGKKVKVK